MKRANKKEIFLIDFFVLLIIFFLFNKFFKQETNYNFKNNKCISEEDLTKNEEISEFIYEATQTFFNQETVSEKYMAMKQQLKQLKKEKIIVKKRKYNFLGCPIEKQEKNQVKICFKKKDNVNLAEKHFFFFASANAFNVEGNSKKLFNTKEKKLSDFYSENLYIEGLKQNNFVAHLQLELITTLNSHNNYNIFPSEIAKIMQNEKIKSFEARLTRGRWHGGLWKASTVRTFPAGATLTAAIRDDEDLNFNWLLLENALDDIIGLNVGHKLNSNLISILNQTSKKNEYGERVLYTSSPSNTLCTENLALWLKLFPCKAQSGLISLFNAQLLAKARYKSLGIVVKSFEKQIEDREKSIEIEKQKEERILKLQGFITLVLQMPLNSYNKGILKLNSLFNMTNFTPQCASANISQVFLRSEKQKIEINESSYANPPSFHFFKINEDLYMNQISAKDIIEFKAKTWFDILYPLKKNSNFRNVNAERQEIRSTIAHTGRLWRSAILYVFTNENSVETKEISYVDELPFVFTPLVHTLDVVVMEIGFTDFESNEETKVLQTFKGVDAYFELNCNWKFSDRVSTSNVFSFVYNLKPLQRITIKYEIIKNCLHFSQITMLPHIGRVSSGGLLLQKPISGFIWEDFWNKHEQKLLLGNPPDFTKGQMETGNGEVKTLFQEPQKNRQKEEEGGDKISGAAEHENVDLSEWLWTFTEEIILLIPLTKFNMMFNIFAFACMAITFVFGYTFRVTANAKNLDETDNGDNEENETVNVEKNRTLHNKNKDE